MLAVPLRARPWPPPTSEEKVGGRCAGGAKPLGILGTPFLSPAHGHTPPEEGKGCCQLFCSQALGLGLEDKSTDYHCRFRWVPGLPCTGAPLWDQLSCVSRPSTPCPAPSRASPLGEGRDPWGVTGSLVLTTLHSCQPQGTRPLTQAWLFLGWLLSWAVAIPLHRANSLLCPPLPGGPWTPT